MSPLKSLYVCLFSSLLLSGCSVAGSGANLVYNRYSVDQSVGNAFSATKAQHYIDSDSAFANSSITVDAQGHDALLTGHVDNANLKSKAVDILNTKLSPKPQHIYNYLTVGSGVSTSAHLNDDWITTKIRSDIVADGSIDPHAVKVVTENSVVYLMGTIQANQAKTMIHLARTTAGVTKVVNLMHYLVPASS